MTLHGARETGHSEPWPVSRLPLRRLEADATALSCWTTNNQVAAHFMVIVAQVVRPEVATQETDVADSQEVRVALIEAYDARAAAHPAMHHRMIQRTEHGPPVVQTAELRV